jgi:hypothetical protein
MFLEFLKAAIPTGIAAFLFGFPTLAPDPIQNVVRVTKAETLLNRIDLPLQWSAQLDALAIGFRVSA